MFMPWDGGSLAEEAINYLACKVDDDKYFCYFESEMDPIFLCKKHLNEKHGKPELNFQNFDFSSLIIFLCSCYSNFAPIQVTFFVCWT